MIIPGLLDDLRPADVTPASSAPALAFHSLVFLINNVT